MSPDRLKAGQSAFSVLRSAISAKPAFSYITGKIRIIRISAFFFVVENAIVRSRRHLGVVLIFEKAEVEMCDE